MACKKFWEKYVGWNGNLQKTFEEEMRLFHLDLTTMDNSNYKSREARIAYISFQFGYHLAAKIPVKKKSTRKL